LIAPDLATVVRGLPNDQYHAFTDPIIPVLLGLGVAGLAGPHAVSAGRRELVADRLAGRLIAVALVGGLVVAELTRLPSFRDPDGGWPAARAAAERVVAAAGDRGLVVVGLPGFKPTDGFVFPLLFAGGSIAGTPPAPGALVIVCDRLFEPSIGAACGGEAERAVERDQPGFGRLVDRFDLSKRSSVSVYLPAEVGG
jgi:hypothetical protein